MTDPARQAPARGPAIERAFASLSVGQVHYASCGAASAPPVLLLHQSPRSWREYRDVLSLLGARYRAIAMDTAGFGDSAPCADPPTIERWAAVAVELLDALGIDRAAVVGHHTGGVIAIELAARHGARVHALVLSSTPWIDAEARRARAAHPVVDEIDASGDGSHLLALWRNRAGFYPPERPDLLEAFVLDALRAHGGPAAGHRVVAAYEMERRIGAIAQPTLVVCADRDPFASPHAPALQSRIAGARLATIAGGMVPLPDQLPGAFADAVAAFLAQQPAWR
ncbi:MAG: alpha/beta fold hydrolase [Lautropia sp.]